MQPRALNLARCGIVALLVAGSLPGASANAIETSTVRVGVEPYGGSVDPALGRAFVGNSGSATLSILDLASETVVTTVPIACRGSGQSAVDRGTHLVYVATHDCGKVSVVNGSTGTRIADIRVTGTTDPVGIAIDAGLGRVYVTNYYSNSVGVIDTQANTLVRTFPTAGKPHSVAVDAASHRIFVLTRAPSGISAYDSGSSSPAWRTELGDLGVQNALTYDPRSDRVFAFLPASCEIVALDGRTGGLTLRMPGGCAATACASPCAVSGLAVAPACRRLFVTFQGENILRVFDLARPDAPTLSSPVGRDPVGVAVDETRGLAIVANINDDTVTIYHDACGRASLDPIISGTRGAAGWWKSDVEVALVALPGAPPIAGAEYRLDGSAWRAYSGGVTVQGAGAHAFEHRALAADRSPGVIRSMTIRIDGEPPASVPSLEGARGSNGWWRSAVATTIAARDAEPGSGVARSLTSVDGGAWTAGALRSLSTDGRHTLAFTSSDRAGNEEAPREISVWIDSTPPNASLLSPPRGAIAIGPVTVGGTEAATIVSRTEANAPGEDAATWAAGSVPVLAAGVDEGAGASGLVRFEFYVDDAWRASTGTSGAWLWDASGEAAGVHKLDVAAVDAAGNVGRSSTLVRTFPLESTGILRTLARLPVPPVGADRSDAVSPGLADVSTPRSVARSIPSMAREVCPPTAEGCASVTIPGISRDVSVPFRVTLPTGSRVLVGYRFEANIGGGAASGSVRFDLGTRGTVVPAVDRTVSQDVPP